MSVQDMYAKLKQVHPDSVMMYKVGSFYHVYGKDANIIAGMFDYLLKPAGNTVTCGFGKNAIKKINERLEMLMDDKNFKNIIRRMEDVLDESGEI